MASRKGDGSFIYLDYAATTPVDPRVVEVMSASLRDDHANAASAHGAGRAVNAMIGEARARVAALINAGSDEIVFTAGATEAINLALLGTARHLAPRGKRHVVTARTEHKAVLDCCRQLEREGFEVTYLRPGTDGLIDAGAFADALRDDTAIASIMHVNNEIGVVQDIAALGAACRERGIAFHVDAAQSAGKLPIDVATLPVTHMSLSAHKVYGPKGAGALYLAADPRPRMSPVVHGGGHERGLRPGTPATHQIVGMGEAFAIAKKELDEDARHAAALRDRLQAGIAALGGVLVNGHPQRRVAGIVNLTIEGVEGESLLYALCELAVSSGSACTSATAEPSYVLRALGRSDHQAQSSLRLSVGRFTTPAEVDAALAIIGREVTRLRRLGPGYAAAANG